VAQLAGQVGEAVVREIGISMFDPSFAHEHVTCTCASCACDLCLVLVTSELSRLLQLGGAFVVSARLYSPQPRSGSLSTKAVGVRACCTPRWPMVLHYARSTPYMDSSSGSDELTVEYHNTIAEATEHLTTMTRGSHLKLLLQQDITARFHRSVTAGRPDGGEGGCLAACGECPMPCRSRLFAHSRRYSS